MPASPAQTKSRAGPSASPTTPTAGTKRKRNDPKFYAVRVGAKPGIYNNWPDCLAQVKGFPNATFKSFTSLTDAELFVRNGLTPSSAGHNSAPKFYAVRVGREPGIYTDWGIAKQQIVGWQKPRYKAFPSRTEAEIFMRSSDGDGTTAEADSKSKNRGQPPSKKKRTSMENEEEVEIKAGDGPLPAGSVDGFDSTIILNKKTGKVDYRSEKQRLASKMQPVGPSGLGELRIYTDGSSLGNGRHGAVAGVGVYFGPMDARNVSESLQGPRQTNQRAELTAMLKAIDLAPRDRNIVIFSDSKYSIMCVTEWFLSWRRNGWLTANKKQVENRDIIEQVLAKIEERNKLRVDTRFEWLKGHADHPGNIAADHLAVEGARMAKMTNLNATDY